MLENLTIRPGYTPPDDPSFNSYLRSMESLVHTLIPQSLLDQRNLLTDEELFSRLNESLPLIEWSKENKLFSVICIRLFGCTHLRFSNGIARFFIEMFDRFAIPGHYLGIEFSRSLDFFFNANPKQQYGVMEIGLKVDTAIELELLQKNLPILCNEVLVIILAVYKARRIVALKAHSEEEKNFLIQEEIKALIGKRVTEFNLNLFDHVQSLIQKILAEEKTVQLKQLIAPLAKRRPQLLNRDIFVEIQDFVLMFRKQFSEKHSLKHLSRIICFQHLIRKTLKVMHAIEPGKHHLLLKFLKTHCKWEKCEQQVLGLVVGINLKSKLELFEASHIADAVTSLVPAAEQVADSCIIDNRWHEIHLIYIEFTKKNEVFFSSEEFKTLRRELAQELKQRIEALVHPVFMSYNQEEVLKDIIQLSHELKKRKDLPQVTINFAFQTQQELSFKVVIVRPIGRNSLSLQKLFSQCPFQVIFEEVKLISQLHPNHLKNQHCQNTDFSEGLGITSRIAKEAAILNIHLPKSTFFRKDRSLDLYKARKAVVAQIIEALGEFRDYNGGLIELIDRTFYQFKELLLKDGSYDNFLLENFFFSIQPTLMQSLLDQHTLEKGFLLFIKALKNNFEKTPYFIETDTASSTIITAIASASSQLKDKVLGIFESMNLSSAKFSFSWLMIDGIYFLTLFQSSNPCDDHLQLGKVLQVTLSKCDAKQENTEQKI
jgi:hypothetical protein